VPRPRDPPSPKRSRLVATTAPESGRKKVSWLIAAAATSASQIPSPTTAQAPTDLAFAHYCGIANRLQDTNDSCHNNDCCAARKSRCRRPRPPRPPTDVVVARAPWRTRCVRGVPRGCQRRGSHEPGRERRVPTIEPWRGREKKNTHRAEVRRHHPGVTRADSRQQEGGVPQVPREVRCDRRADQGAGRFVRGARAAAQRRRLHQTIHGSADGDRRRGAATGKRKRAARPRPSARARARGRPPSEGGNAGAPRRSSAKSARTSARPSTS